jgi:hypothetical protein
MVRFVQRQGRGLLVLSAVIAIALAACSGSTTTAAPSGSAGPGATEATSGPIDTTQPATGSALSGAGSAFSALGSYKYSMTLVGGSVVTQIEMLPGTSISDPNAPVTIKGTVVSQPDPGVDVKIGDFHMIVIGGFDYFDTGSGYTQASDTGLADAFSPVQQFTTAVDPSTMSGYSKIATESKNGVQADHYQASTSALAYLSSISGVQGTWTSDVWIATNGGYPVSMSVVATAGDSSIAYEILFDITNINAASNNVAAPSNVTGA